MAKHNITWAFSEQQQRNEDKSFLTFFVVFDFKKQNVFFCVSNDQSKHALHCYHHFDSLNRGKDFNLNGNILLKVNRTEACVRRMKFNSVSYENHQIYFEKPTLDGFYKDDIRHDVTPFVANSNQIEAFLRSLTSKPALTYGCSKDKIFCEFSEPNCIDRFKPCKNNGDTVYIWDTLYDNNTTISLDALDVHRIRNISISISSTKGFISFVSESGIRLDRIEIEPILDTYNNSTTDQVLVKYGLQSSQLFLTPKASFSNANYQKSNIGFWIYVEFPQDVNKMCSLEENAKIFIYTKSQLSFLGHILHNPRYWYGIEQNGANQIRASLQNDLTAEIPPPIFYPGYSSIPSYSGTGAKRSIFDTSFTSSNICHRIPWANEEAQSERVILSTAIPISLIISFLFLVFALSYKMIKIKLMMKGLHTVPSRPDRTVSLDEEFNNVEDETETTTEETEYYRKRRKMKYKEEIEHTNIKSFISLDGDLKLIDTEDSKC